jgi:hypothetical protein
MTYPRFQQGSQIFENLASISSEIPIFPSFPSTEVFTGSTKPTMEHIIMDLFSLASPTIDAYDVSADQTVSGMTKAALIASMVTSSPEKWGPSSHMLAIHSLACHPHGTLLCNPQIPIVFKDNTIVQLDGERPAWDSSFCPPGSLTEIHVDYHGAAVLMVNIHCNKLWLLWPATSRNLKWWEKYHTRAFNGASITSDALTHLEGLQVIHATNSKAFILPPYHLHAVFTFEASAHSGIALWGFPWWEESRKGIEWEINWALNHSVHGCSAMDALNVLKSIKNESLGYWQEVANRFPQHEQAASVREWLASTDDYIQHALDTIETYVESGHSNILCKRKATDAPRTSKKKRRSN